jgi:hypothetical protein
VTAVGQQHGCKRKVEVAVADLHQCPAWLLRACKWLQCQQFILRLSPLRSSNDEPANAASGGEDVVLVLPVTVTDRVCVSFMQTCLREACLDATLLLLLHHSPQGSMRWVQVPALAGRWGSSQAGSCHPGSNLQAADWARRRR